MKQKRGGGGFRYGCVKPKDAALMLHVSREYFESLVQAGELVADRRTRGGHRLFSIADLLMYKQRRKEKQHAGLTQMMQATQRLGLYDAELDGLPSKAR